jgi:hypothetical protein
MRAARWGGCAQWSQSNWLRRQRRTERRVRKKGSIGQVAIDSSESAGAAWPVIGATIATAKTTGNQEMMHWDIDRDFPVEEVISGSTRSRVMLREYLSTTTGTGRINPGSNGPRTSRRSRSDVTGPAIRAPKPRRRGSGQRTPLRRVALFPSITGWQDLGDSIAGGPAAEHRRQRGLGGSHDGTRTGPQQTPRVCGT